jgi:hypothetical protein
VARGEGEPRLTIDLELAEDAEVDRDVVIALARLRSRRKADSRLPPVRRHRLNLNACLGRSLTREPTGTKTALKLEVRNCHERFFFPLSYVRRAEADLRPELRLRLELCLRPEPLLELPERLWPVLGLTL